MAAETPVLEHKPAEKFRTQLNAIQSYMDCIDEEAHNARIRDNYARLINPESKVEDVVSATQKEEAIEFIEDNSEVTASPVRPYYVESARTDSILFRADSSINKVSAVAEEVAEAEQIDFDDEDEDLRPTPTTIQYQTIGRSNAKAKITSSADKKEHILGKKEKIIIAVFIGVVIALLTLVIVNSSIIASLNADIASVQSEITAVRGALVGVNASVSEIVPDTVRNLLMK